MPDRLTDAHQETMRDRLVALLLARSGGHFEAVRDQSEADIADTAEAIISAVIDPYLAALSREDEGLREDEDEDA